MPVSDTVIWVGTGRRGPQGGVGHREEWATWKALAQGGVEHTAKCSTERSGSLGRVWHRKEWDTWRSGPYGGVGYKEK